MIAFASSSYLIISHFHHVLPLVLSLFDIDESFVIELERLREKTGSECTGPCDTSYFEFRRYTHHKVFSHVVSLLEQVAKVVLQLRASVLVRLKVETVHFQQPFFLFCQLTFFLLLELSEVERRGQVMRRAEINLVENKTEDLLFFLFTIDDLR